ncbi:hypothetical protein [Polaromonas naphthalenivorans]|uniref:Helix-turn-helix domain-containing protein n=1 Tax=Polaromonas naphthalenivorans (strain CJ2) TaxID=365044 RepID=A1VJ78_POLNA|nr:hypothetical protein [Polaromonas naphthalenivorans]ABM35706.1 hypothetical protein Pnap_0383 [Polaromonas naphthalenivorans CJ2]
MSASLSLDLAARLWRCALPRGISKLVLQCFCHHVNNESGLSWPSIARVALMCGLSARAVQGHVRGLVTAGILRPRLRIGHATRYTVHLDGLMPLVFAAAPGAGAVDHPAPTPAAFAVTPAENGTPPPQISTPTPAESAPITVLNRQENTEGTGAPALPAALMVVDGVNPEVLADFAAIRQAKRTGPVTAAVIEAIGQQARLAGLSLEQALQTCCEPRRRWARFEAGWLQATPGGRAISPAATATTAAAPAPALWKPPVARPAAPEVVAAGRARIAALRQATVGAGLGSSKGCGWAHAAIEKHQSGQPVRRAVLRDACAALRLNPASLAAARMH